MGCEHNAEYDNGYLRSENIQTKSQPIVRPPYFILTENYKITPKCYIRVLTASSAIPAMTDGSPGVPWVTVHRIGNASR